MTLEIWLTFMLATTVVFAIPGPVVITTVHHASRHGKAAALPMIVSVMIADAIAMTLSMTGVGALLYTSATLFALLKYVGALYLTYLAINLWRQRHDASEATAPTSQRSMFRQGFLTTVLNPKSILFFVSFMPLFIDIEQAFIPQFVILLISVLLLSGVNITIWFFVGSSLRRQIGRIHHWFASLGAITMLGMAGALLLSEREQ